MALWIPLRGDQELHQVCNFYYLNDILLIYNIRWDLLRSKRTIIIQAHYAQAVLN
jgi:hypothetical protein